MPIDLKTQTVASLRNLLANSKRLRNAEMELAVAQEMHERGIATSREYTLFPWNQDRVDEVMKPFVQIAAKIPNNQRVTYTKAGGRKTSLPKDDPKHLWIDSYSAIKASGINFIFVCEIKKPGEDPRFVLYMSGSAQAEATPYAIYNADQLQEALAEWEAIAHSASASVNV